MKQLIYIIGFVLSSLFLLTDYDGGRADATLYGPDKAILEEADIQDMESCLAILSQDLKNSNFLSPRRVIQTVTYNFHLRSQSKSQKNVFYLRLKEYTLMSKLWEETSITHQINFSALLSHTGYRIFALRKLII